MTSQTARPSCLDELLAFKQLASSPPHVNAEIQVIAAVDVTGFSEADVRANIIDPIVRLLDYKPNSIASIKREKTLPVLGSANFADYSFMLFFEHFWLAEAKKPNKGKVVRKDLLQALQYAAHPEVNAALILLCDGIRLTVFDRETSLVAPVFNTLVADLPRTFDQLRHLLDPWAIWFFEKRRIARLVDKVFDKEFNLERAAEFAETVKRGIDGKRSKILNNFRSQAKPDMTAEVAHAASAAIREVVEVLYFLPHRMAVVDAMTTNLIKAAGKNAFAALHLIFPDNPRDANSNFYGHGLHYLIQLEAQQATVPWLPAWLRPDSKDRTVETAVKTLIGLCLTHFRDDEARNCTILLASALRRVGKIALVSSPSAWRRGELEHILHRYTEPELDWSQITSSPEGHMLRWLDRIELLGSIRVSREMQDERGTFLLESAKARLRELWHKEVELLSGLPNYAALLQERNLVEIQPTEAIDVDYDFLGHLTLCVLEGFPRWKEYALAHHRDDIVAIAAGASWQACQWLGLSDRPKVETAVLADRFFLGDQKTCDAVRLAHKMAK
jgi:hypothetical protein